MDSHKFDYYWKIGVLVALLSSMAWLGYGVSNLQLDQMTCLSNPFVFGADRMVSSDNDVYEILCHCNINDGNMATQTTFTFNDKMMNPTDDDLYWSNYMKSLTKALSNSSQGGDN